MAPTAKRLGARLGTTLGLFLVCAMPGAGCRAQEERIASEERPTRPTGDGSARQDDVQSLLAAARDHRRQGRTHDALAAFRQAEGLARELGDRDLLADVLLELGLVYRHLADYHLAVSLYSEALDICRDREDLHCQAEALHNLGVCLTYLGELKVARDRLSDALAIWKEDYEKGATLTALGTVSDLQGEHEVAIEQFRQALLLRHKTPGLDDKIRLRGKGATLDRLATAYKNAERREEAHKTYQNTLGIWQELGVQPSIGITRENLGWLYVDWQKPDHALEQFEQARSIFEQSGLQQSLAHTLLGMGRAYRQKGDLPAATGVLERAIDITDSLRSKPQSPRLKASFLAHRQQFYELHIDVLMQRHRLEKDPGHSVRALEAAERFRARSLLELLNEERAALRHVADKEVLTLEDRLHREMSARDRQRLDLIHRDGSIREIASVEKEQRYLSLQYQQLKAQLRSRLPDLPQPEPLRGRQLRGLLDDDTRMLFYALGEDRSFLWLVSPEHIVPYQLPSRQKIESEAQEVYRWFSNSDQRGGEARGREAASRLSEMLLGPVAEVLGDHRLVIVADGLLNYVPFGALQSPGSAGALIAEREVVSIPSASVISTLRRRADDRRPPPGRLAVVADPVFGPEDSRLAASAGAEAQGSRTRAGARPAPERLIHSAEEGRAILDLVPEAERYAALGFDASREAILAGSLDSYRLIHLAVHGQLHDEHPEYSHLVLSLLNRRGQPVNGRLYMHEIDDLHMPADLVVLSACNTALGKLMRGEGMIGMTRVFMDAGASRVLVSLWYVDDQATARLMERFYHEMLVGGRSAAAALRAAQSWMREESKWQAPYYWAGFVLQGDWR